MSEKKSNLEEKLMLVLQGIQDVKGLDITIMDLRSIPNTACEYFVLCNGNSNTQVNAITNSVQKVVSKALQEKPWHVEGTENGEWVLMDFVDIVVHIFQPDIRTYYNLEDLWGDAKVSTIECNY
jgi:ribosome-associated protein